MDTCATTQNGLMLSDVKCCICGHLDATLVGAGRDFEYQTSADTFRAMKCNECGLVYLNPRPDISEFETIYPPTYHSLNFSKSDFGLVFKVRSWLERRRLLRWCEGLSTDARILDVGCGGAFHLGLLKRYGKESWHLEGIDIDKRAVAKALQAGILIHEGTLDTVRLGESSYDLVLMIQTIEHVGDPDRTLAQVHKILKPGGRLIVVTDNTASLDFRLFKRSYWGGYHFPRHWNLFDRRSLARLADNCGYRIERIATQVSPVNWVYSIHNLLVDRNAPALVSNLFNLHSTLSLACFTLLDFVLQKAGKGALLTASLTKKELGSMNKE